jgi:hypothetical protein
MQKKINEILIRRKVAKLSATFFCCVLILGACKKNDSNIGDGLSDEQLNVSKTDTFTIVSYSELVDSVESDETAIGLLGAYVDPVFGKVDCGTVLQITPSSINPDLGTTATTVVDSVVLSLKFTGLLFYGNPCDLTFEVYEITDDLVRDDQDYYAFQTPNHTGANIILAGSETQTPDPYSLVVVGDDTLSAHLRIPLLTSVGDEFVADNSAGLFASEEVFIDNFKGLYVKVNSSSLSNGQGAVFYLSPEDAISGLTMYFHDGPTAGEFSFLINSNTARYNQIQFDRTGTDVEALLADTSLGMNSFFMQAGAIRAVVKFPHIMDFVGSGATFDPKIINRAELVLPVQDYTPDAYNPSRFLFITRIIDDKYSDFTVDYDIGSAFDGNNAVYYDPDKKEFRFQMTRELQHVLTGGGENVGYRIYPPSFFASSVERVIFNGQNTTLKDKPRLEITYTDY